MYRVCLILPGLLPVPATQGGAVETLVTTLIKQNEVFRELDLYVVTSFDDESKRLAASFRNTHFIFVPTPSRTLSKMFHRAEVLGKLTNTLPQKYQISDLFHMRALRMIKDIAFDAVVFEGGTPWGYPALRFLYKDRLYLHVHFCADHIIEGSQYKRIIAVSNYAAQAWKHYSTRHDQDVRVVLNGIETKTLDSCEARDAGSAIRAKLGFAPTDFVVLCSGRIIPVKGLLELTRAVSLTDDRSIKLLIIGSPDFGPSSDTEYSHQVQSAVEHLGRRAKYLGYVPHDKVVDYQYAADVQVVPSLWEDAAPLSCVEAMAAGLPLIVTKSGGMQEYTQPECAITVEKDGDLPKSLAHAIANLKRHTKMLLSMSKAGRLVYRRYTPENFYHTFVKAMKWRILLPLS